jgi:hypothetical protein
MQIKIALVLAIYLPVRNRKPHCNRRAAILKEIE